MRHKLRRTESLALVLLVVLLSAGSWAAGRSSGPSSRPSPEDTALAERYRDLLYSQSEKEYRLSPLRSQEPVPPVPLNDLHDHERVTSIDLLSIDVELHEPQVLRGFDIARFKPGLVCIEAHPEVRQAILDYFASNRYVVVGKYIRADQQNLYFQPLDQRRGRDISLTKTTLQPGAATK